MLNFYELLSIVGENENAIAAIREDFNADFRKNFEKIQINNTTRKNAVLNFSKNESFFHDKEVSGLYGTATTVFIPSALNYTDKAGGREVDVYNSVKEWIKAETWKPEEEHIKEDIATARALGWTPGNNTQDFRAYHINVGGNRYNFNLVYEAFMMIADNKDHSGGCEVFTVSLNAGSDRKALVLRSKYGICFVLPVATALYEKHDVSFNKYMQTEKELDAEMIERAKKSA